MNTLSTGFCASDGGFTPPEAAPSTAAGGASGGAVDGSATTPADGRERTTWRATLRQGTRGPERVVELVAREDYLCAWTCVAPTHPPESHTNGSEDGSRAVLLALCDLLYETDEQLVRLERVP